MKFEKIKKRFLILLCASLLPVMGATSDALVATTPKAPTTVTGPVQHTSNDPGDAAAIGHATLYRAALIPQNRLIASVPGTFVTWVLVLLLSGLALWTAALFRMHLDVRKAIRRMLAAAPDSAKKGPPPKAGLRGNLNRLETSFGEMDAVLKAQTATLNSAYELAGLGTWVILPDRQSVWASSHVGKRLGFPEGNDIVHIDELRARIVPQDLATFDAALKRAIGADQMAEVEFRALDAHGDIRVFHALNGLEGAGLDVTPGSISGIIQDITSIRHTEAALARSLTLERLAGEVARIGGWRYDIATRKFGGTPEAAELVGLEEGWDPSVEDATRRFVDAKDRKQIMSSFWTCVGAGERFDETAKFRKFDGTETWLRVIGEAERDQSGKIVAIYGALQNINELIEAHRASEESRMLLRTVMDGLSDGFVTHDCDGTIRYMNRRAHSILGVADKDLVGGNIWKDLHWTKGSQFKKVLIEAIESRESARFEGEITRPEQWISVVVHPTPAGVAIYLDDVTEERASRERLRLLNASMDRLSDVILITDANTQDPSGPHVVFVNDAFVDMTGFTKDDIMGNNPRMLQGSDTERERLKEIRTALRSAQPIRTELTNYRKDGSRFIAEVDINPLFDDTGVCTHFVAVQRDTTRRREAEENLRAREEQFRLANLASQDIVWDWDLRSGVISNFENAEGTSGTISQLSADNPLEGRIENVLERIHPDDRLKITETLDAALAGDAQTWHCEYRVSSRDGGWRNVADKAFIVREDNGEPRRMVGAMSDITELRDLDARLHQAQKLETVGQLTGGIAHDFNNLLTIILGNCDILLDDIDEDSELRPLLQSIEDAAERGARVSNDLLAYSRRQPLELRPTDINELMRQSSSLFGRATHAGVEIRYELTDAPMVALVDPYKLQAALLNLVLNAVAAIEEEGRINIRTRAITIEEENPQDEFASGDYVQVEVTDNGSGMTQENVARAFEPFFTTKELGVGTGMGLSSVYGLVKQSGGHATIESELGNGTTVTLSLLAADVAEPIAPVGISKVAKDGGGQRILVVEDDAELRSFVRTVLSRMGYRIIEAETGAAALELLEKDGDFDLLFTDIVMPGGVNGVQLAQKAQEIYPDLKILFTSGYARDALPRERHVPSEIPMLYKPFRTIELVERIKHALANTVDPMQ